MARTALALLPFLALPTSCRSPAVESEPAGPAAATAAPREQPVTPQSSRQPAPHPWSERFEPPLLLETERVRLEPLAPRFAELDFEALMGSREHLRRTLRWGDWPREDFTLAENRADLERHWGEFERREAYAYTVLAADGSRCVGCIYLNPIELADLPDEDRDAVLAWWVIEDELASDLDRHLLEALLDWFAERWPLEMVFLVPRVDDRRGAALLRDLGLAELDSPRSEQLLFVWEAP